MVVFQGASVEVRVHALELVAPAADSAARGEDAAHVVGGEELRR